MQAETETVPEKQVKQLHNLSHQLASMFQNDILCDISFKLGGDEPSPHQMNENATNNEDQDKPDGGTVVKAHKVILASRCPYFEKMFTSGMKETTQSVIVLPDVRKESFTAVLEFIYTAQVNVDYRNAVEIFSLADRFCLEDLKELCVSQFTKLINTANVMEVLVMSHLKADPIFMFALAFLETLDNLSLANILSSDPFLQTPKPVLIEVLKLRLDVEELQLFQHVVEWAKHQLEYATTLLKDQESSNGPEAETDNESTSIIRQELRDVFPYIRFSQMDNSDIFHFVEPTGLVDAELLLEGIRWKVHPELCIGTSKVPKYCWSYGPRRNFVRFSIACSSKDLKNSATTIASPISEALGLKWKLQYYPGENGLYLFCKSEDTKPLTCEYQFILKSQAYPFKNIKIAPMKQTWKHGDTTGHGGCFDCFNPTFLVRETQYRPEDTFIVEVVILSLHKHESSK